MASGHFKKLLRTSLKYKVKHGRLPVWVAVCHPLLANAPLREVLKWAPKRSLAEKEIDRIIEKELFAWDPLCGQLTKRQRDVLFLVLPPRAKYLEPTSKED